MLSTMMDTFVQVSPRPYNNEFPFTYLAKGGYVFGSFGLSRVCEDTIVYCDIPNKYERGLMCSISLVCT